MTVNCLEEAMRRVFNDRRIFGMPRELIGKDNWKKLREAFFNADGSSAMQVIAESKAGFEGKIGLEKDPREKRSLEEAGRLLNGLEVKIKQASPAAGRILGLMDSFGPLRCNLPDMEDYGKVIEGHARATAEQFFLYKIQKDKDHRRRQALAALLEVVIELYDRQVEPLEIAFFVRKIESLEQIVEVLK